MKWISPYKNIRSYKNWLYFWSRVCISIYSLHKKVLVECGRKVSSWHQPSSHRFHLFTFFVFILNFRRRICAWMWNLSKYSSILVISLSFISLWVLWLYWSRKFCFWSHILYESLLCFWFTFGYTYIFPKLFYVFKKSYFVICSEK